MRNPVGILRQASWAVCLFVLAVSAAFAAPLELTLQRRDAAGQPVQEQLSLDPSKTAVVVIDMWDQHWCESFTRRAASMIPRMNETLAACRKLGMTVVFAPSNVEGFYDGTPARSAMLAIPAHGMPEKVDCKLPRNKVPTDFCECGPDRPCRRRMAWTRQHAALVVEPGDYLGDCNNGRELLNLCAEKKIDTLLYMGVASNLCILNRQFGMVNMSSHGMNTLLCADLTNAITANGLNADAKPDANFTPAKGSVETLRYIEQYAMPTVESRQLLAAAADESQRPDTRKHVVFVIADPEYHSAETLPKFARSLPADAYRSSFCTLTAGKSLDLSPLYDADLVVLSMKRQALPLAQSELLERYIRRGNPLVVLRTGVVPFDPLEKTVPRGHTVWRDFDREVLGCNYENYNPTARNTGGEVQPVPEAAGHAILQGLEDQPFHTPSWLYRVRPLADNTTVLLTGTPTPGDEPEPVAWTRTYEGGRVFYTSLGHPGDFELPQFKTLLRQAVDWALDDDAAR